MSVHVEPVTPAIGATISGVDLREPLAPEVRDTIEKALLECGVLFFRDQDITPEQQVAFASQFGTVGIPPISPNQQPGRMVGPEVMILDQVSPKDEGADNWHSDNTFMREPPLGSILKAVQLPSIGGDTCFANAAAAYEALSDSMRRFVLDLVAVHDIAKPMTRAVRAGIFEEAKLAELRELWPSD